MRLPFKRTVGLLGITALLPGCVVLVDPPSTVSSMKNNQHVGITISQSSPNTEDLPVVEKEVVQTQSSDTGPPPTNQCQPFRLPPPEVVPELVDLSQPEITTQEDVELALVTHINDLRGYIQRQRRRLIEHHATYVENCEQQGFTPPRDSVI